MHAKGVTCSDCHDPHTGKLRADGNARLHHVSPRPRSTTRPSITTTRPRAPARHASPATCRRSTYMVVDARHDHSLRVPRPDLSVTLGTPNACNSCHTKQDARWAATRVNAWYGHDPQGYQRFASAFSVAQTGASDGQSQLRAIAGDSTEPAIVRATALAQIDASAGGAALETVAQSLRDASALVRFGALRSLIHAPLNARVPLAAPLLSDPLRATRVEAVSVLETVPDDQLPPDRRAAFERAAERVRGRTALQRRPCRGARQPRNVLWQSWRRVERGGRIESGHSAGPILHSRLRESRGSLPCVRPRRRWRTSAARGARGRATKRCAALRARPCARSPEAGGCRARRAPARERAGTGQQALCLRYGVALHSAGKVDAAKATLAKVLARHPDDEAVRAALASFTKDERR